MKILFLFIAIGSLLATTGCLVSDGGRYHEHGYYGHRNEVILRPPVLVVRPPEIIVR